VLPDIKVEIISDYCLIDIGTQRFDAGVWDGEQVRQGRDCGTDQAGLALGGRRRSLLFPTGRNRRSRRNWSSTIASICACPPMADCTRGNSKSAREN
jgi:hypothetical protein